MVYQILFWHALLPEGLAKNWNLIQMIGEFADTWDVLNKLVGTTVIFIKHYLMAFKHKLKNNNPFKDKT